MSRRILPRFWVQPIPDLPAISPPSLDAGGMRWGSGRPGALTTRTTQPLESLWTALGTHSQARSFHTPTTLRPPAAMPSQAFWHVGFQGP